MKQFRFLLMLALAAMLTSTLAFATDDGNFLIGVATGLPGTDTIINLSDSGASNGALFNLGQNTVGIPVFGNALGTLTPGTGNLCANIYVFSQDEQEQACCACPLTPNALASVDVENDLLGNTLTGVGSMLGSAIIKIIGSETGPIPAPPGHPVCDPGNVNTIIPDKLPAFLGGGGGLFVGQPLASGLLAWQRQGQNGENIPLVSSTLSANELKTAVSLCHAIQLNGSGHGICATMGCTAGGR